jgi:F-type H+-transporting ATPase subunit delta
MVNVSIARRYARALLDVAAEAQRTDAVADQLASFVKAIEQSSELSDVLLNPAYSRSQRTLVVEALMKMMGIAEPALANTLRLLVDRNRLIYLPDIARAFRDMADAQAGRVRGVVTSATVLPQDALEQLRKNLQQLTQRDVILESRQDPALLGGVSAQVGSVLYDGSVRTQLEQMRRELKQRG